MQVKNPSPMGQLGDVDLRLLRVFKAVVDCGGMAAAELELNLAMSTISRHVKDLEARLNLVLCRRGRGGFALTPEGKRVYAVTGQLLAATDAFRGNLHDIHGHMGGDLHVALFEKTASNPAAHLPDAIALFRRQAPQVHLHLHVGTIAMIERGVMDGQYHLGVIPEHRRSNSLAYDRLFDENMHVYASPGHPWFGKPSKRHGWAELKRQDLVGLGYHSPNMLLAHGRGLERSATASDQEAVATLVLSGMFLGFLPDHYAQAFVERKRMQAVSPELLFYRCVFSCIRRRSPAVTGGTETFRQALMQAHRP